MSRRERTQSPARVSAPHAAPPNTARSTPRTTSIRSPTWVRSIAAGSRVIVKAEGVYLWDSDGNKIIDGMAGLWCVNVGYGRKELADAAYRQMQELPFYNTFFKTTHPPVIELSALLAELAPAPFNHFFYCNSGSEGNDTDAAHRPSLLGDARQAAKKFVISRKNGYHGSTIAGGTLGGMGYMHEQMPSQVAEHRAHRPAVLLRRSSGDLTPEEFGLARAQQLEAKILEVGADNVAAFIGEPFQGAGGVIFPPSTYWPEIQRICRKYDILLVADEVIGGFGRTGEWFAHQHFGFEPDLITLAKGLTSGYVPMGAVGLHDRVAKAIIENGEFNHGLTYSGHPVAAAVAVANLKLLRDEKIVERVKTRYGSVLSEALARDLRKRIRSSVKSAGDGSGRRAAARRRSAHAASVSPMAEKSARSAATSASTATSIMRATGDRMLLSPPLVITHAEIDEIVAKAKTAIDATARLVCPGQRA